MSTIKVDTITTRTGSGNITVSNALSGTDIISTANIASNAVTTAKIANNAVTSGKMFSTFENGIEFFETYRLSSLPSFFFLHLVVLQQHSLFDLIEVMVHWCLVELV